MHAALPNTPLDIIGDIHGEHDALLRVLNALGYDDAGRHPQGRSLVFVGDLCDRGPDSPGVVARVRRLVEAGRAVMILGNHELNLLRGDRKPGNDWFWGEGTHHDTRYAPFATVSSSERTDMLEFFSRMPLTLSRDDLRVTHAAWHGPSVARLSAMTGTSALGELFEHLDEEADVALAVNGWSARAKAEKDMWRHHFADPDIAVPMLDAVGQCDEWRQMLNPVRVLTSGVERRTLTPFFASGQWRFAERVRWWDEYTDEVPVVVGHYWRQFLPLDRAQLGKGDPDLFEGVDPRAWLGPRGNVFCVDFSVGGRYQERSLGEVPGARTRLAALRWPERQLVLDTGECLQTQGFRPGPSNTA